MSVPTDDDQIAAAWAGNHAQALEWAYQRWAGLVNGLARAAVGPTDADDVTQQVFVSAWRGRATYDPDKGPLGAWLVGITRRRVADLLRTRHRLTEVPSDPATIVRADPDAWEAADSDDLLVVYEELERMGDPRRRIVLLAHVHGRTHPEIAELLDLPLGTVKSHLSRTMDRLRTRLGGDR